MQVKECEVCYALPTQRRELIIIGISFFSGLGGILIWEIPKQRSLELSLVGGSLLALSFLIAGAEIFQKAFRNLLRGNMLDELSLMSIASIGALFIGAMEEAVGVLVLYRVGEYLQEYAVQKSRSSIRSLLSLRPDTARVLRENQWREVHPADIKPGDILLCRSGERLPVDGEVIDGSGAFDTSALTGESLPRRAETGSEALAGFIVQNGVIKIKALRPASESAITRILALVEQALEAKAKPEVFIHQFAKWYTPTVVAIAFSIAFFPPLFLPDQQFRTWIYRSLVLLVISCPCALVISVPLTYFAGLGGAARKGILIKGASVIDTLAKAKTVVFDKTGTLTDGKFQVKNLFPANGFSPESLLEHATAASLHSNHPLSQAVQTLWKVKGNPPPPIEEGSFVEIPGHGSAARLQGQEVLAGNDRLLHLKEIPHPCEPAAATVVHIAVAGTYAGKIELSDQLKKDAQQAIKKLARIGIQRVAVLTGDGELPARQVAAELGVKEVHTNLLPEDKVIKIEEILQSNTEGKVLFVGDGINDAPVLARSDAGIAMGKAGTDAAIESADVVLMTDELSRLPQAIQKAQKTRRIVFQNIFLALGIKGVFLSLGSLGYASLWESVLADVGVALLAVINALRALR